MARAVASNGERAAQLQNQALIACALGDLSIERSKTFEREVGIDGADHAPRLRHGLIHRQRRAEIEREIAQLFILPPRRVINGRRILFHSRIVAVPGYSDDCHGVLVDAELLPQRLRPLKK